MIGVAARLAVRVAAAVVAFYGGVAVFERLAPRRWVRTYQRSIGGPLHRAGAGMGPGWVLLETVGRRSGLARQVPLAGRLVDGSVWLVAGRRDADFVRNVEAQPRVRVRVSGRWRAGTGHLLPGDDAARRAVWVNPFNGLFVRVANPASGLLTVRIDLDGDDD